MIRKRNEGTKDGAIRVLLLAEDAWQEPGDMSAPLFDALSRFQPDEGLPYAMALCTVPKHRREEIGDWYADLLNELGWEKAVVVAHKALEMLEAGHVAWERVGGLFLIDAQDAKTCVQPTKTSPCAPMPASIPTLLITTIPPHATATAHKATCETYSLASSQAHFLTSPPHLLELLHAFCRLRAYPA
jgi:hypothetical protein